MDQSPNLLNNTYKFSLIVPFQNYVGCWIYIVYRVTFCNILAFTTHKNNFIHHNVLSPIPQSTSRLSLRHNVRYETTAQ